MKSKTIEQVFGLTDKHLAPIEQGEFTLYLHKNVIEPFQQLQSAASKENIDIQIASSFRSFERQALIWNEKFNGKRPVFDKQNQIVDMAALTDWQKIQAILTFSALPGASRHHWGTELDIFDASAMPDNYQLQLTPDEYSPDGIFSHLSDWLKANINRFGFYQPYLKTNMGIAQELWHISQASEASYLLNYFKQNSSQLLSLLEQHQVQGYDTIKLNFDEILHTYIYCASDPKIT